MKNATIIVLLLICLAQSNSGILRWCEYRPIGQWTCEFNWLYAENDNLEILNVYT